MASTSRDARRSVAEALEDQAFAFDFFQVVRLIEAMSPDRVSVGSGSDPSRESLRFSSDLSLAFPASSVVDVELAPQDSDAAKVGVSFLGIGGQQGPLPHAFTELLLDRVASKDTAGRDFLDIFNHRLVSLLYRARSKNRVGLHIQRPEESRVADVGFSLIGMGASALRGRLNVPDRSLLSYSGLLSHGLRTAAGLRGILSHHFAELLPSQTGEEAGVQIHEFVGRWHELENNQWTRLGWADGNCRLGIDSVLGHRIWDQQTLVEIELGPLSLENFERFLPGGDAWEPLLDIASYYLRDELDFLIRPVLKAEDVPATVLTTTESGGARLGLTSWLGTEPRASDAADVVLVPKKRI